MATRVQLRPLDTDNNRGSSPAAEPIGAVVTQIPCRHGTHDPTQDAGYTTASKIRAAKNRSISYLREESIYDCIEVGCLRLQAVHAYSRNGIGMA
jgi:hypothetical protein